MERDGTCVIGTEWNQMGWNGMPISYGQTVCGGRPAGGVAGGGVLSENYSDLRCNMKDSRGVYTAGDKDGNLPCAAHLLAVSLVFFRGPALASH